MMLDGVATSVDPSPSLINILKQKFGRDFGVDVILKQFLKQNSTRGSAVLLAMFWAGRQGLEKNF